MKKETFDKYVNFLQECWNSGVIYDMKSMARKHKISDAFVNWMRMKLTGKY